MDSSLLSVSLRWTQLVFSGCPRTCDTPRDRERLKRRSRSPKGALPPPPSTFVPGGIPEQMTPVRGTETRLLVEMDDPESHFHIYHTSSHVLCGEEKTAPQLKNEYK